MVLNSFLSIYKIIDKEIQYESFTLARFVEKKSPLFVSMGIFSALVLVIKGIIDQSISFGLPTTLYVTSILKEATAVSFVIFIILAFTIIIEAYSFKDNLNHLESILKYPNNKRPFVINLYHYLSRYFFIISFILLSSLIIWYLSCSLNQYLYECLDDIGFIFGSLICIALPLVIRKLPAIRSGIMVCSTLSIILLPLFIILTIFYYIPFFNTLIGCIGIFSMVYLLILLIYDISLTTQLKTQIKNLKFVIWLSLYLFLVGILLYSIFRIIYFTYFILFIEIAICAYLTVLLIVVIFKLITEIRKQLRFLITGSVLQSLPFFVMLSLSLFIIIPISHPQVNDPIVGNWTTEGVQDKIIYYFGSDQTFNAYLDNSSILISGKWKTTDDIHYTIDITNPYDYEETVILPSKTSTYIYLNTSPSLLCLNNTNIHYTMNKTIM